MVNPIQLNTSKKHKVAMVLDNPFNPDLRVLKEARTLIEAGNDVTIYAWDRDRTTARPATETINGIQVIRIPAKSDRQLGFKQIPHYLSFAYRAFRLIAQGKYNIVHCHDLPDLPVGVLLKLLKRVRLVYDAHEIYWLMEANKYPKSVLAFIRGAEFVLMRFVDVFITVGYTRAEYFRHGYHKPIFTVGNWYNPITHSEQAGSDLRSSLGISREEYIVTYAGILAASRGTGMLAEIAEEFKNHHPHLHLVVAGAGYQQQIIADHAGKNPKLHYLGWLDNTTALYSASDALLYLMDLSHPYANYNSPNNLYLAIAWGLPLIAVKAGEIASILGDVAPTLLVNRLDAKEIAGIVNDLFADAQLQEKIREQMSTLQSSYNWNLAQEQLISAYNLLT